VLNPPALVERSGRAGAICLAEGGVQHPFSADSGAGQVPNEIISGRHYINELMGLNSSRQLLQNGRPILPQQRGAVADDRDIQRTPHMFIPKGVSLCDRACRRERRNDEDEPSRLSQASVSHILERAASNLQAFFRLTISRFRGIFD
jgi:hypothetical protein